MVRLLDEVEPLMSEGRGHGERVGRIAAELARLRGCTPGAVARTQLAGRLHDVGRAGLPREAVGGPGGLTGELLEAWRTFPTRSADLLQITAGPAVATAVRAQRERWDGTGFPDGIRGDEIPEAARIIAAAHLIDEAATGERLGPSALAARLHDAGGALLDPESAATAADQVTLLLSARG